MALALVAGSDDNGMVTPLIVLVVIHVPLLPSDTLAEWLRRRPAKPMGSPRVGSNPTGVDLWQCRHVHVQPVTYLINAKKIAAERLLRRVFPGVFQQDFSAFFQLCGEHTR